MHRKKEGLFLMKNIAMITGATGGLGREFVRQLIEEVDEVWAIGRNIEKLNSLENTYGRSKAFRSIYQISGIWKR